MKEQRITIDIDAEGRLQAEAEGFTGDVCVKDLEAILGDLAPALEVRRKPDAGAARVSVQQTVQRGRKP